MNVEIAERLAARRKQAGLSQEALAEKLGVSRQAVSKWERSESSPDTDNLIALARLYGVSLDELLYVDDSIADDVAFEAEDRAAGVAAGTAGAGAAAGATGTASAGGPAAGSPAAGVAADASATASGCDPAAADAEGAAANDGAPEADDPASRSRQREHRRGDKVRIGPGGIHVEDGDDYVHVSWREGVHVVEGATGEEVHVGWDGVRFGGHDAAGHAFVRGDDPFDWHRAQGFRQKWMCFPFWLVVILAYLLAGIFQDAWGPGLFLFFLVPVYYVTGVAIAERRLAPAVCALYPLGVTAWFFWVAFVEGAWHPAWAIFLTIPIVECLAVYLSHAWRRRRRARQQSDAVIDVEGQPGE